ncbi:MAG: alpha/beta hydrolase [Umezawaea sp.]
MAALRALTRLTAKRCWHSKGAVALHGERNHRTSSAATPHGDHRCRCRGVRRGVADAADAITALHTGLVETDELARRYDYRIGEDGTVVDTSVVNPTSDPAQLEQRRQLSRERDRVQAELADRVREALRRAEDIDHDLAEVMRKAAHGEIGTDGATTVASAAAAGQGHGALSTLEPPSGGTVVQNAAWWQSLSSEERWSVLEFHPDWVGNLDGIPAWARNQANRSRLWAEQKALGQEYGQLQAVLDDPKSKPADFQHAMVRLDELDAKLAALDKIGSTLQQPGGRQLLVLDTSGEDVRAAIATGDVDTAENVVTFTGGFGSTVAGDIGEYDHRMDQLRNRADDLSKRYGDGGETAAITWMGYDAPQSADVSSDEKAQQGSRQLARFLDGIDVTRPDNPPHTVAVGHSYGSTTTGLALRQATGVDDAIFLGSPGIGTHDLTDLKVPSGHSFLLENKKDPVADFGTFGGDPTTIRGMNHLSTSEAVSADGRRLEETAGHSSIEQYLRPDTTSQYTSPLRSPGSRTGLSEAPRSAPATSSATAARRTGRHPQP